MEGRQRLSWVQRNHGMREGVQPVACRARQVVEDLAAAGYNEAAELAITLGPKVDDQFRSHCLLAGVRGEVLVINVDQVGLVCPMRLAWSGRLERILAGERRWRSLRRVRFEFGDSGSRLNGAYTAIV